MTEANKTSESVNRLITWGHGSHPWDEMTERAIAAKYQNDQISMANAVEQLRQILPLVDALHKDHWPSSPPTRIEAAIGTLEEALAFDPLSDV